ncbi:MAG: hypothetical protein WD696_00685 [Bryobacteraceae bacterium]
MNDHAAIIAHESEILLKAAAFGEQATAQGQRQDEGAGSSGDFQILGTQ